MIHSLSGRAVDTLLGLAYQAVALIVGPLLRGFRERMVESCDGPTAERVVARVVDLEGRLYE